MLTFASNQGGAQGIYSRRADGRGPVEPIVADREAPEDPHPLSWSPDGAVLIFRQSREAGADLWIVPAGRPEAAEIFLRTQFYEDGAAFSPDGRWVAYHSDETGASEVYVTSYPDQDVKKRVSRAGGFFPRWGPDSKRLFFGQGERVMVVAATDSRWTPSPPKTFVDGIELLNWDVTPDGQSVITLEKRRPIQLHLVQNWFAELERLVPMK